MTFYFLRQKTFLEFMALPKFTNQVIKPTPCTDNIKFTYEKEHDGSIPLLDTLIVRKPNGSVKLLVFRKATHTDQYLNFASHHPIHHKLGVVCTLLDRMNCVVTKKKDVEQEEDKIKRVLNQCGYPEWMFNQVKRKMDNKHVVKPNKNKDSTEKNKGLVIIPYVKKLSETTTRILKSMAMPPGYALILP
ncbi:uncharacterized protein [Amphiura filiformis]|uniref:uncharacterized protein n=1 Tax=Amphiura filiformis TaxID=82378 RepID=UPI003B21CFE4